MPALRAYLQSFDAPEAFVAERSGRWLAVASWPPEGARPAHVLELGERALVAQTQNYTLRHIRFRRGVVTLDRGDFPHGRLHVLYGEQIV